MIVKFLSLGLLMYLIVLLHYLQPLILQIVLMLIFIIEKITILNPEVSFINLSSNDDTILWDFGDNKTSDEWEPIHTYDSLGWFEVILKVQNNEGCADSIAKQLLVENNIYYFPSSFTPDGDGLNDEFGVSGFRVDKIQNYIFKITNRWGEIVFYLRMLTQNPMVKHLNGHKCMPGSGQFV